MALKQFHLHINALVISEEGQHALEQLGFKVCNFKAGELGRTHFVPKIHLSNHEQSAAAFKPLFSNARSILVSDRRFVGYLEGEYVTSECTLVGTASLDSETGQVSQSPFVILFENARRWRQAELHVRFRESDANAAIIHYFHSHGFYCAERAKGAETFRIFTVQGYYKAIGAIYDRVKQDFRLLGKNVTAHMKLERSAGYYLSSEFTWLPMQASAILSPHIDEQADK